MRLRQSLLAIATILIFPLPVSAQQLEPLRMAHPPLALHELPLLVATEKGLYEKEGFKVTHSFMTGGNEAATALMGGNVNVVNSALTQPINLKSRNVQIKIIAAVAGVRDFAIVVDKKRHGNAKGLASLKGMRIATPRRGADSDQILRYILETNGFNLEKDVQLIQMGNYQNQLIAMENGDVDATILTEPFFTNAVREGTVVPVYDLLKDEVSDSLRQRIFTCLFVTEDFLKTRQDAAERIVRATKNAVDLMYQDQGVGLEVARKYFPSVKPEVMKEVYSRLASATTGRAFETKLTPANIAAESEFLTKAGLIKAPITFNDAVFDMSKVW
jgi:NitT/TauT family transport system substrate-binding protein